MTFPSSINKFIFRASTALSFGLALTACGDKGPPPFLWEPSSQETSILTEEEQKLVYSIDSWLKQVPFEDLWDPYADKKDGEMVVTNTNAVFPFLNKWYKSYGQVNKYDAFRSTSEVFYADPKWGRTILTWAGIKKQPEPIYLSQYNGEAVSALTPGYSGSGYGSSSVRFDTTKTISETKDERQAVLWGLRRANDHFLTAFLERGNLLFLVAFPCAPSQLEACAEQLGEVSRSLSLNVTAWENLTAEGLEKEEHDFFFKAEQHDLFEQHEIFKNSGPIRPRFRATINGLPFKKENNGNQRDNVIFSYQKPTGDVRVTIHQPEKIAAEKLGNDTADEYLKDLYSGKPSYRIDYDLDNGDNEINRGRNAYFEETIKDKAHNITAHSSLSSKHTIKIEYEFPTGDEEARLTAEQFITTIELPYFYD